MSVALTEAEKAALRAKKRAEVEVADAKAAAKKAEADRLAAMDLARANEEKRKADETKRKADAARKKEEDAAAKAALEASYLAELDKDPKAWMAKEDASKASEETAKKLNIKLAVVCVLVVLLAAGWETVVSPVLGYIGNEGGSDSIKAP